MALSSPTQTGHLQISGKPDQKTHGHLGLVKMEIVNDEGFEFLILALFNPSLGSLQSLQLYLFAQHCALILWNLEVILNKNECWFLLLCIVTERGKSSDLQDSKFACP